MSKRSQNKADQRARILEAAQVLFSERGVEDVTMADIAAEAGVARSTVFNHFGSKHALMNGITERVRAVYVDLLDQALADRTTPTPALIRALFEFMGMGIENSRRFYRAVFREMAKLSVGLDEGGPAEATRQAAHDRLFKLIARGQARGDLSRDHMPEDLTEVFDSLVNGTITHWLYDDSSEPLSARMVRTANIFLGPVAAEDLSVYADAHPAFEADLEFGPVAEEETD